MKERSNKQMMEIESKCDRDASSDAARAITVTHNSFDTRDIFVDTREVTITHGSDRYRLRLTAQNKLILTK
jgi:hemin uptake protein HemP